MKNVFPPEWRTQNRRKRRFYAKYMRGLERAGYILVCGVLGAFIFAFNYPVDDLVTADKVPIQPYSQPLKMNEPVRIVRALVSDLEQVRAGQPLVEVVAGEEAIRRFEAWQAVKELGEKVGQTGEVRRLLTLYPQPPVRTLRAPAAGTVRIDSAHLAKTLDPEVEIARVVDYRDLRLAASLAGPTVANAKVGQMARVTSIAVEPESGALFRGDGAVSGRILGEGVKKILQEGLAGAQVRLRNDVPLSVTDVTEVQVDASVQALPADRHIQVLPLDPPGSVPVEAQVVEGTPSAAVQVADLPSDVAKRAQAEIVRSVAGRTVRRADGTVVSLSEPEAVRMVVKLKASRPAGDAALTLEGTSLSRTFDAQLRIASPPSYLVEAVRAADRAGKPVTARVELRTGRRPIALLLLRKS